MRINTKTILSIAVLALVFGVVSVPENSAQILKQILTTMEGHKNALQSLKADVKMSEYDAALKDEITKSGTVYYIPKAGKDARIRIDWVKPEESILIDKGQYIIYRKNINQAIVGTVDASKKQKSASSALKFMSMSKKELEKNYDVQYIDKPTLSGTDVWHLKLTPKGAESFKEAELWVDGNGMPVQAMIREKNKDETTIRLSSIKKNTQFDVAVFLFDLKGVKIVKG